MQIAPSILSADFLRLHQDLPALLQMGISVLHLDVMDGHFVPNLTFGPPLIACLKPHWPGLMEAHLMMTNPDVHLEAFVKAGCNRIIVHQEVCWHLHKTLQSIKNLGAEAGVVLNPATPVETISEVLPFVDLILLMTVNPGFGGQIYLEFVEEKIQKLVRWRKGHSYLIEVDGGIKREHLPRLAAMGVDLAVVGSAVFNQNPVLDNLKGLMSYVDSDIQKDI